METKLFKYFIQFIDYFTSEYTIFYQINPMNSPHSVQIPWPKLPGYVPEDEAICHVVYIILGVLLHYQHGQL